MSIFSWFRTKPETLVGRGPGARHVAAPSPATIRISDTASLRKKERARLRDLLYKVVRESMVRAGVLSSNFSFKVLATDPRGQKFIVMMNLARDFGGEILQLAEIETMICEAARARHNITVSAVYWRAEEVAPAARVNLTEQKDLPPATPGNKFEPVHADEVAALRRALADGGGAVATLLSAAPKPDHPTNHALLTGYENTEIIESEHPDDAVEFEAAETQILEDDTRYRPLGPTQYGDLR